MTSDAPTAGRKDSRHADADRLIRCMRRAERDLGQILASLHAQDMGGGVALEVAEASVALRRRAEVVAALASRRVRYTKAWATTGASTPHAWYASVTGDGLGEAKKMFQRTERIAKVREVESAWRANTLATSQAALIAKTAEIVPDAVSILIQQASQIGDGEFRQECARRQAAAQSAAATEAKHARAHRCRYLRFRLGADGAGRIYGAATPEVMAQIRATLDPYQSELIVRRRSWNKTHQERADKSWDSNDALMMDALCVALHSLNGPLAGEDLREVPNCDPELLRVGESGAGSRSCSEPRLPSTGTSPRPTPGVGGLRPSEEEAKGPQAVRGALQR